MFKLIKASVLITFFVLFLASSLSAQTKNDGYLDMKERVFDFGLVPQDTRVIHDFKLINIGGKEVNITEVKPNCGCTTAPVSKKNIVPGDSTIMEVTFKTGKRTGKQEKFVNVTTDMEPRGLFKIVINAWVETPTQKTPPITAEPRVIDYTPADMKNTGQAKVEIESHADSELQLEIVGYSELLGEAKLKHNRLGIGKKTTLVYDFKKAEDTKILYGAVTVHASGEGYDFNYTIPITQRRPKEVE